MKIESKRINILGSSWLIKSVTKEEDPRFKDGKSAGLCDHSVREILIEDVPNSEYTIRDPLQNIRHVLRHEIVHAFLFESGVYGDSLPANEWAMNEEMVDFFAHHHEKMHEAFRAAGALDKDVVATSQYVIETLPSCATTSSSSAAQAETLDFGM